MKNNAIMLLLGIYIILAAGLYILTSFAPAFRISLLEVANALMATLSLITYMMVVRQLNSPQAFVRNVMGSSFLKLMVYLFAMLVYVFLNRNNIHKPSIFVLFALYGIYLIAETWLLSKIARKK